MSTSNRRADGFDRSPSDDARRLLVFLCPKSREFDRRRNMTSDGYCSLTGMNTSLLCGIFIGTDKCSADDDADDAADADAADADAADAATVVPTADRCSDCENGSCSGIDPHVDLNSSM